MSLKHQEISVGLGESTAFKKCSLGTLARVLLANTVAEDGQEMRPPILLSVVEIALATTLPNTL